MIIISLVIAGCNGGTNCADCPPTPCPPVAATEESMSTANFHHLKMDSAVVVNSFMSLSASDFRKMVLNLKVNKFSKFPDSLTLVAYPAKNNNDITAAPQILNILPQVEPLTTDMTFSTLEILRSKLRNLVGASGQARKYDYILFIPYVADSSGRKYLSYRLECRPTLAEGVDPNENLNPCPPFKPE